MNEIKRYKCMIDPGYIAVSDEPTLLSSVCGNGVIITLWDKVHRAGGMAHCIYPKRRWLESPSNYQADVAIPILIRQFVSGNVNVWNLEAQLFGGGNLNGFSERRARSVVKTTRKILKKFKINITSEDIGGNVGRKIIFDTFSGDIMVLKTKNIRKTDWAPEYIIRKS